MNVSEAFEKAFDHLIMVEGGYVDDPLDSGGKTAYGVTEDIARSFGYQGEMRDLSLDFAKLIYKTRFWDSILVGSIFEVGGFDLAYEVFDTAVNMGTKRAIEFLQRALNALEGSELAVDGFNGRNTMSALREHIERRDDSSVLVKVIDSLQGAHYVKLVERRSKDRRFIYGWFKNRVAI